MRTISVATASDQNYAMGLCVMICSLLENLEKDILVHLYILADHIEPKTKNLIEESWKPYPISVFWLSPDNSKLEGKVQELGHAGVMATYYRFFIAELLPISVNKVIYLDVDLIIKGNIGELDQIPMDKYPLMAVPDAYSEHFHLPRLRKSCNWSSESSSYFNAGVLVIDLDIWRQEKIADQALEISIVHKDEFLFHDQDALNYLLNNRWKPISITWNFHELPQSLSAWKFSLHTREEKKEIFQTPKIIHFTAREKPWSMISFGTFDSIFHEYRKKTCWVNWTAPKPPLYLKLYYSIFIGPNVKINWCIWRGIIHSSNYKIIKVLIGILVTKPWTIFSYPAWVICSWIREKIRRYRGSM